MSYKYDKLLGRITEVFGTQEKFAKALGMSPQTLSYKLNNKVDWRRDEIKRACELLSINFGEVGTYFFTLKIKIS